MLRIKLAALRFVSILSGLAGGMFMLTAFIEVARQAGAWMKTAQWPPHPISAEWPSVALAVSQMQSLGLKQIWAWLIGLNAAFLHLIAGLICLWVCARISEVRFQFQREDKRRRKAEDELRREAEALEEEWHRNRIPEPTEREREELRASFEKLIRDELRAFRSLADLHGTVSCLLLAESCKAINFA